MTFKGRYTESPPFITTIASGLADGDNKTVDYSRGAEAGIQEEDKYLPFNIISVTNTSNNRIKLKILHSGIPEKIIPANSIVDFEIEAVYGWKITNNSGSVTDDVIEVWIEKKLTERKLLKKIAGLE